MFKMACAALCLVAPTPLMAAAFTFENVSLGSYQTLTVVDSGLTLTLSTVAGGRIDVADSGSALVGKGVVAFDQFGAFAPLTYSFDQLITSALVMGVNAGGNLLNDMNVAAYDPTGRNVLAIGRGGVFLARMTNSPGYSYFVVTTPLGGASGVFSEISQVSFVPGAIANVPEPATWALMIGGFGLAGMAARRRQMTRGSSVVA